MNKHNQWRLSLPCVQYQRAGGEDAGYNGKVEGLCMHNRSTFISAQILGGKDMIDCTGEMPPPDDSRVEMNKSGVEEAGRLGKPFPNMGEVRRLGVILGSGHFHSE